MSVHRVRLDAQRHAAFLAEQRRDPITKESLCADMEIVICANERIAFIADNWPGECPFCHSVNTLATVPANNLTSFLGRGRTPSVTLTQTTDSTPGYTTPARPPIPLSPARRPRPARWLGLLLLAGSITYYFSSQQKSGFGIDQKQTKGLITGVENAYVNTQQLNLRSGPGSEYGIVTKLSKGDLVICLAKSQSSDGGTWEKVRAGSSEGWVNEKLLSKSSPGQGSERHYSEHTQQARSESLRRAREEAEAQRRKAAEAEAQRRRAYGEAQRKEEQEAEAETRAAAAQVERRGQRGADTQARYDQAQAEAQMRYERAQVQAQTRYQEAQARAQTRYQQAQAAAQNRYQQAQANAQGDFRRLASAQNNYRRALTSTKNGYERALASAGNSYERARASAENSYKRALVSARNSYQRAASGSMPGFFLPRPP